MCLCLSVTVLHPLKNKERQSGMFYGQQIPHLERACCPLAPALVMCLLLQPPHSCPLPTAGCSFSWCLPANESSSPDSRLTCAGSGSRPDCPLSQRLLGAQLVALGRPRGLVWPLDQLLCSPHWLQRWAWPGRGWLNWYG